jgi:caa(3)-type oxidase subunit IV
MSSHADTKHSEAQHGDQQHGHAEHGAGHHRNYVKIWAILLVLLLISIFGPFLEIRVITLLTAFGVAVVKAYMVAKNFMHLDIENRIVKWALAVAVVFMVMLFAGVSPDVMHDDGHRWKKDEGFHPVEAVGHVDGHGADAHGAEEHGGSEAGGAHDGAGAPAASAGADSTGDHATSGSTSDGH